MIELPTETATGFAGLLAARRTIRDYADAPLALGQVAGLLKAGQGSLEDRRAAPSAGAFYPVTLWLAARNVEGLGQGVYAYDHRSHALTVVSEGGVSSALDDAALEEQPWVGGAAAVVVVLADVAATRNKFHEQPPDGRRGERYVHMEAGAIAQNMYLQCADAGIGGVLVAGFDDDKVRQSLGLPPELEPEILFCAGALTGAS